MTDTFIAATTQQLEEAVTKALHPMGFKRKASTWYLDGPDCVCLINLQKSNYGGQLYVNLAVSAKQLEANAFPKEHQSQLRGRLSEITPGRAQLEANLNFEETSSSPADKISRVVKAICDDGVPILLQCQTLKGLKEQLNSGKLEKFAISLRLRNLLGV